MTREEEIKQAAYSQYCNSESICFTLMCDSFKQGAKWADKHTKFQWIDADEDLPCNHNVLIIDYEPYNSRETKPVLVSRIDGEYSVESMYKDEDCIWRWSTNEPIAYWMIIPKLEED